MNFPVDSPAPSAISQSTNSGLPTAVAGSSPSSRSPRPAPWLRVALANHRWVAGALAGLLACGPVVAVADEQGWTRFRGPNGSGHGAASGLPAEIDESSIAWRAPLPGAGHSSPVLWNDTLFLTAEDEDEPGQRQVLALAAANGEVR